MTQVGEEFDRISRCWNHYGNADPYYSVLTDPRNHKDNIEVDVAARNAFFETGVVDVGRIEEMLRTLGRSVEGRDIMDYGCGVGRLTAPLARHARTVYGVDVSESHLAICRSHMANIGVANVQLHRVDDPRQPLPWTYDLAVSLMVLQHNRPTLMRATIATILRGLRPGGLALLHLPMHIPGDGSAMDPLVMEMHALPESEVVAVARECGCELVHFFDRDLCGGGIENGVFALARPGA